MRRASGIAVLGAGLLALFTLPAQALELGPVQVILQPRVVVAPERPRPRVVVVEEPACRPIVERRVVVVRRHGHHWRERELRRAYAHAHDRDAFDPYEREPERVVIIRR